jgi:hypothetical protein
MNTTAVVLPAPLVRDLVEAVSASVEDADNPHTSHNRAVILRRYWEQWENSTMNGRGTVTIHVDRETLPELLGDVRYREEFNRPTRNGGNPYGVEDPDYKVNAAARKVLARADEYRAAVADADSTPARKTYPDTAAGARDLVESEMNDALRERFTQGLDSGEFRLVPDPVVPAVWGIVGALGTPTALVASAVLYLDTADFEVEDEVLDPIQAEEEAVFSDDRIACYHCDGQPFRSVESSKVNGDRQDPTVAYRLSCGHTVI